MTISWTVTLTYAGNPAEGQLMEWDDELDSTVAAIPGVGFTAVVWIDADNPVDAAVAGAARAREVIPHEPRGIEVLDEETYGTRAEQPTVPELVSSVEAGEILGVSRQRVAQLHRQHPRFPAPLYELRTGPLWTRTAIEWFAANVERRPGRPSRRAGTRVAS